MDKIIKTPSDSEEEQEEEEEDPEFKGDDLIVSAKQYFLY